MYAKCGDTQQSGLVGCFTALMAGMAAPLLLWLGYNSYALDDLLGTASKMGFFGITKKTFVEWFDHPIFKSNSLTFLSGNLYLQIYTFWRGEVSWANNDNNSLMRHMSDIFYVSTSIMFVILAVVKNCISDKKPIKPNKFYKIVIILLFIAYLVFIILLSIQFDFGHQHAPSVSNPFFNKGRLIIGSLVFFVILYIDGLVYLIDILKFKVNPLNVIFTICLIVMAFTINASYKIFGSSWNWFHLLA
jgi:hypothetical protein